MVVGSGGVVNVGVVWWMLVVGFFWFGWFGMQMQMQMYIWFDLVWFGMQMQI